MLRRKYREQNEAKETFGQQRKADARESQAEAARGLHGLHGVSDVSPTVSYGDRDRISSKHGEDGVRGGIELPAKSCRRRASVMLVRVTCIDGRSP